MEEQPLQSDTLPRLIRCQPAGIDVGDLFAAESALFCILLKASETHVNDSAQVGSQGFAKFYANMVRGDEILLYREPQASPLHMVMSTVR